MRCLCLGLVLTAIALGVSAGPAQYEVDVKVVFERALPNIEGKRIVTVVVSYPPGSRSPAHHHAPSAFIYAHVLSGAIRSQVDDEPVKVYRVGEGFYEVPGSHHRISENASDRDPASLLAVFVVDSKDTPLTTPDKK
jgi:quercetin dioxygenase-like cupin family protein